MNASGAWCRLPVLLACALALPLAEAQDAADLLERLRGGGLVVYLRHTHTGRGIDLIRYDEQRQGLEDCSRQRDLDHAGEQQARRISEAFRRQAVSVAEVLASPYCRTRKTARIAFGDDVVRLEDGIATVCQSAGERLARRSARLRTLLSSPVAGGGNRVLVSHNCNIRALWRDLQRDCARQPEMGDAVLFEPRGDGAFLELGCIPFSRFEDWAQP